METAHTHKQTGQFVILQHCLPRKFRSQNMSRYLEGLRRRLWVAQSDPHEWVKVGDWAGCSCSWCSYTICMHNYIYKTTCIYDYHIYLYIYIYTCIWLETESTQYVQVSGCTSDRHLRPTDLALVFFRPSKVVEADWGARALSFSMIFLGS